MAVELAPVEGEPSPLACFITFITLLSTFRDVAERAGLGCDTLVQDLGMLLQDNCAIGIRSRWVRRVAMPLFQAWKVLKREGIILVRAREAKYLIEQCTDDPLRESLLKWLNTEYGV